MEILNIQKPFLRKTENGTKSQCGYCSTFLNLETSSIKDKPWDTVLYESDNFVVVPSLGAIVEGWLLIVTKQHILCMGALSNPMLEELQTVLNLTCSVLARVYSYPTVFEHGPSAVGENIGCGIDHAHIHVAPLQFNLLESAKSSSELHNLQWAHVTNGIHNLHALYSQRKSYLFVKLPQADSYVCPVFNIPRQFLRRVIAKESGLKAQYDYRKHSFTENVIATIAALKIAFGNLSYKSVTEIEGITL